MNHQYVVFIYGYEKIEVTDDLGVKKVSHERHFICFADYFEGVYEARDWTTANIDRFLDKNKTWDSKIVKAYSYMEISSPTYLQEIMLEESTQEMTDSLNKIVFEFMERAYEETYERIWNHQFGDKKFSSEEEK